MINGGNFVFLAANSSKYKCKLVPSFRACSYLGDTFYGISEIGKATALEHRLNHEQKLLRFSFFFPIIQAMKTVPNLHLIMHFRSS